MTKIVYTVYWPGGNRTALLYQKIAKKHYALVARRIMKINPTIEQVGFVSSRKGKTHLEMMGGEFCANAARCIAYELANPAESFTISGFNGQISGKVKEACTDIKLSGKLLQAAVPDKYGTIVRLQGISFLVVPQNTPLVFNKKQYLSRLANKEKAAGIVTVIKNRSIFLIKPLIYVRDTNTLVEETACGSGSIAAVLASFPWGENVKVAVVQPSGIDLKVKLEFERKKLKEINFSGPVIVEGVGSLDVKLT